MQEGTALTTLSAILEDAWKVLAEEELLLRHALIPETVILEWHV
jgi:hypothetical protein